MLQRELTREQAIAVAEQVLQHVEGTIIERGYSYFSDGVVFNTRVENNRTLCSDVQGSQVYHVRLDLEEVQGSSCTCPYTRLCKHIAATFFQMYSVFENPRHFLGKAQQPRRATFSPAMLIPNYRPAVSPPQGNETAPVQSGLTAASSVHDWWAFFESWTRNLLSAMESFRASSEIFSSYQNVLSVTAGWPTERAQLFHIHANLFHLQKLQQYVQTYRQSHWYPDLAQTAERLLEQLEGAIYFSDRQALWSKHRLALEETLTIIRRWKENDLSSLYWVYAYHLVWWSLLDAPEWIEQEKAELDETIASPNTSEAVLEKARLLRAHFSVMDRQDDLALAVWMPMRRLPLAFYLPYMKAFAREAQWQRFLDWTTALTGRIGQAEAQQYRFVLTVWREAMKQVGREAECGAMLKTFLPSSYPEYALYLYEEKQFKSWIDLQMSFRVPFADLSAVQLKEIEEADPALLYPYYVREVNRLIRERNRTAYKEAIKLLKRGRATYAKADQEADWERFVDRLSAKHNRLRAFQEELRRGNLNL
ncbi:SWIM zinc finger family protein [Brevibacillus parabrevis]|nr:SWIM zinc finger family protein [Brevibacillus parabrevis]WDV97869.1 SWIM zinc finger family protein [Brevibacillus parabrevis]